MTQGDEARQRAFDALMAKAGMTVPEDRKAGVVAGYLEYLSVVEFLRQPRTAANEPSNTYSLVPFLRKG